MLENVEIEINERFYKPGTAYLEMPGFLATAWDFFAFEKYINVPIIF